MTKDSVVVAAPPVIHDFMDPLDSSMQSMAGEAALEAMLPPAAFRSTVVLKAMRKSGMKSLSTPGIFIQMARRAAAERDVADASRLLGFLAAAARNGKLSFSSNDFRQLRDLEGVGKSKS